MFRSFHLGRAFGIPLYLHPSFLLLPLYLLFVSRGEGLIPLLFNQTVLLSIFGCVLLHELGHALMARCFGIATRDITLYPIGGVARLESTGDRPLHEIAIALAGPAVNFAIVLLLGPLVVAALLSDIVTVPFEGMIAGEAGPLGLLLAYGMALCVGNTILLMFNLIPAFPMDGGRVLRAILSLLMPRLRATEIAAGLGLVVAVGLAVLGIWTGNFSLILVSLFVGFAGQMELFAMRQRLGRLQPVTIEQAEVPPRRDGFTGMAFDPQRGVWVRWYNGMPLD